MKKSLIATVVASTILLAGCNGDAQADATVFGSVEQAYQKVGGVSDIVNGDTFVGVKVNDAISPETNAFGVISIDVDSEGANATTTKDAYVGLELGGATVSVGRMPNVQKTLSANTVDIFEGSSLTTDGAARNSNTVKGSLAVGGVNLVGAVVSDGSNGEDVTDSYEVGASVSVGYIDLVGAYAKDKNTDIETRIVGGSTQLGDIAVAGTFETDETAAGVETDTLNAVASIDLGQNTIKGGYQDVDGGADTKIFEAVHNFSSKTSAYINVKDVSTDADNTWQTGVRVNF